MPWLNKMGFLAFNVRSLQDSNCKQR